MSNLPHTKTSSRTTLIWGIVLVIGLAIIGWSQFGTGWGSATNPAVPVSGAVASWAAITIAVSVQAFPFLVLGVTISSLIAAYAPAGFLQKITPRNQYLAVPVASTVAVGLPGCECASVPVAQSFMRAGVSKAAALVFMLASPALNPIVIVSTAVAFYALPQMVWARFIASFVAVVAAGWVWIALKQDTDLQVKPAAGTHHAGHSHPAGKAKTRSGQWQVFYTSALHDLTHAGGFLVLGAMIAGLIKVLVPVSWFVSVSEYPWLAVLLMAAFAILLSLCSEADAFVAASFTAVSPTAQLAFLVIGPMIDIKLISMQIGAFGARFVRVFLPVVAAAALASSMLVGWLFFGVL